LNDGYNTRNLSSIVGSPVVAETIDTRTVDPDLEEAPAAIAALDRPTLRRQVWLTAATGERLMYGVSWWNRNQFHRHLHDPDRPIGRSLSDKRTEVFRELLGLQLGHSTLLEEAFATTGPFWGRYYLLWHQQQPLTLIYEVFSNAIARYLGPSQADG
jgi:chorismate lyase